MGGDGLVPAGEPAQVEYRGPHRSLDVLRNVLMPRAVQLATVKESLLLQGPAGAFHSGGLHVKADHPTVFAYQIGQNAGVVTIAQSRVDDDIAGLHHLAEAISSQIPGGTKHVAHLTAPSAA